jgi:hemerythrin-like domain-containing protein
MPTPVELLHSEHVQLARLLDLLEACLRASLKGPEGQEALELMACLVRYPNQFHHPVEELLFERMLYHDLSLSQLLEELTADHQRLTEQGEKLLQLIERAVAGEQDTVVAIERAGMSYIEVFRTHMEVEEADVLPLADGLLEADDWRDIETGIERIRSQGLDAQAAFCYQKFTGSQVL